MSPLPIQSVLAQLLSRLERHDTVLLQAPPGAGKTTAVPPALLDAPWRCGRRILMLEPRRLAARSAARFMARERGEPVGQTVGYRVRLESRVSAATRIEIVTEGVLTRMIQSDPELSNYAAVLFDEFHERSIHADLGLALVRESQQALREDLRILIMSATLEVEALSRLLDSAPVVRSEGRTYPVEVVYRPARPEQDLSAHTAASVRRSLAEDSGSILVFLPGAAEIRRVAKHLDTGLPEAVDLAPLYGHLSGEEQDAAIAAAPDGRRKVVLATSIAESSLTIEGIRVVIDAGQQRRSRFDPNSGMSRLVTSRLSRASAEQRSGRAGRLEAGKCYRLWSPAEQASLAPFDPPEIVAADLAPLVLELALWGAREADALSWLDPPPDANWRQARDLLQSLNALDNSGAITDHGRRMVELGLHPRLSHLLLEGRRRGKGQLAADLVALLSERDVLDHRSGCDLALRYRALQVADDRRVHRGRAARVRKLARSFGGGQRNRAGDDADIGGLLALAFPDRIAQARDRRGRFRLSNGRGAFLFEDDPLAGAPWLVAAELDGQAREARIFLAAALSPSDIETSLADQLVVKTVAEWDEQHGTVRAFRRRMLGALTLEEIRLGNPDAATLEAGLLDAVRRRGLDRLNWSDSVHQWRARAQTAHELWPDTWPDFSTEVLLAELDQWLGPFLAGRRRWAEVEQIDWIGALKSRLDYTRQKQLDEWFPPGLALPTGRTARLDYCAEGGPVLAVKLQSLFGLTTSPRLAQGALPVVIHLLSPAGRPLAVTADLESFWKNAYPEVRKDMRGRYPKHPWPEDPLAARPSEGVKQPRKR